MTRFTMKTLGALVAVGCGSSAMASPSQGYWAGYYDYSHQTSPDQSQATYQPASVQSASVQSASVQPASVQSASAEPSSVEPASIQPASVQPASVQPSQIAQTPDAWDEQGQAIPESQPAQPSQPSQPAQPSQQPQNQNPWNDQDQEEDSAETFSWSGGQSHLGIMVMGLTSELRMHFGAPSNLGVLIARVEPNSAAARAGIQVGDVLVRVGRTQVRAGDDVIQALAAQSGGRIMLLVIRQGQRIRLGVMLPASQQQPQPPHPQLQQPQQQRSPGSAI